MTDVDPKRSANMARIRSTGTKPEYAVRRALHASGFRFRLHRKDLPGKPDIVLPRFKVVVFVHGCFWHQHGGCKLASWPKTRTEYWEPKLSRNVERDRAAERALTALGWTVLTIWECDTRKPEALASAIGRLTQELRTAERGKDNNGRRAASASAKSGLRIAGHPARV